jgi:hypothetical protein
MEKYSGSGRGVAADDDDDDDEIGNDDDTDDDSDDDTGNGSKRVIVAAVSPKDNVDVDAKAGDGTPILSPPPHTRQSVAVAIATPIRSLGILQPAIGLLLSVSVLRSVLRSSSFQDETAFSSSFSSSLVVVRHRLGIRHREEEDDSKNGHLFVFGGCPVIRRRVWQWQ